MLGPRPKLGEVKVGDRVLVWSALYGRKGDLTVMSRYQWTQENVLLPVISGGVFTMLIVLLAGRHALLAAVIVTGAAMVLWLVCLIADYGATIRRERQEDVDTSSKMH